MNTFGRRVTNKEGNGVRAGTGTLIVVFIFIILIIALAYVVGDASAGGVSLLGMLGNPFKTTRKMKVPYKSREGHRERAFTRTAKVLITFIITISIVGTYYVLAFRP